jgi:hypothetical protein
MAWDEQRRMRDAQGQDTAKVAAVPSDAPDAAPPPADPRSGGRGWEDWGRRFGWLVAVALSVTALLVSVIALSNAGSSDAGFHRNGHGMFGAPGPGYGYGSGPQQGQPTFPGGQGYGSR